MLLCAGVVVLLNGATGAWDELAIALVGLGVLWLAVKLAGRKQVERDGEAAHDVSVDEETQQHVAPPD